MNFVLAFAIIFAIVFGILLLVVPLNPLKRKEEEEAQDKEPDRKQN